MEKEIQRLLDEKVNPLLANHFGAATLTGLENNVAKVRLSGACGSCPSAQFTLEDVVKTVLMNNGTGGCGFRYSVSDDLIDMAKKILNKRLK